MAKGRDKARRRKKKMLKKGIDLEKIKADKKAKKAKKRANRAAS